MKWSGYAGRPARSDTKSKISSRGAEMTVETVTSRTAAPLYAGRSGAGRGAKREPSGGLRRQGEPPLARVHPLRAYRMPALLGQRTEAQLAQHAAGVQFVQALSRERDPAALSTTVAGRSERAETASKQHRAEIGHVAQFGRPGVSPPNLLPHPG